MSKTTLAICLTLVAVLAGSVPVATGSGPGDNCGNPQNLQPVQAGSVMPPLDEAYYHGELSATGAIVLAPIGNGTLHMTVYDHAWDSWGYVKCLGVVCDVTTAGGVAAACELSDDEYWIVIHYHAGATEFVLAAIVGTSDCVDTPIGEIC